jgi:DNA repair protein RadC
MGSRVSGGSSGNAYCEDDRALDSTQSLCQLRGLLGVPGDDRADPGNTGLSLKARKELGLLTALLTCTGQKPAAATAQHLLDRFGSLSAIVFADAAKLETYLSETPVLCRLFIAINAALAHVLADDISKQVLLGNRSALYQYLRSRLGTRHSERFHVLYLNSACHLIRDEMMGIGTLASVAVYPRDIMVRALELGAAGMILVHNHPSGDSRPSQSDITVTRQIVAASRTLDLTVHDHLIVARSGIASFHELGLM